MNITYRGVVFQVVTELDLELLIVAIQTYQFYQFA